MFKISKRDERRGNRKFLNKTISTAKKNCLRNLKEFNELWQNNRVMQAVRTNNTESLQNLLEKDLMSPDFVDHMERSPLHVATSRGYANVVSLLLRFGADPNMRDSKGNTPLHLAACTENLAIVRLLLDAGTDVTCMDKRGRSPLELAQSKLHALCHYKNGTGAPEMAIIRDQLHMIIWLLSSFLQREGTQKTTTNQSSGEALLQQLQLMNINMNATENRQEIGALDEQMNQLLDAIQHFQLNNN